MRFADRAEAGRMLAEQLVAYKGADAVVYALPRGGVPVAYEIAQALDFPLDLVITRKIGHPANPEYAICAVTEAGEMLCDEAERHTVDSGWLDAEAEKGRKEAARRRAAYRGGHAHVSPTGKVAIVVDDGVATGLSIRAAIMALRAENPAKIIVATPCAPHDAAEELRRAADGVVVLTGERGYLGAVGAYYDEFPQVTDKEVIRLLR